MTRRPSRRLAAVAVSLVVASVAASAAVVDVSETLDLSLVSISQTNFQAADQPAFAPPPTFSLAAGDTLSLTIDFAGSQSLTVSAPSFVWAYVYANEVDSDVRQTGTMSFLGADGQVLATSTVKTDIEGSAHVGQQFFADSFSALPPTLTFYGLRYDGTLDEYLDPNVTTRGYTVPVLDFEAAHIVASVVPEPAAGVLLLAGLGVLAARRRRHGR